jgi:hypothetical protein
MTFRVSLCVCILPLTLLAVLATPVAAQMLTIDAQPVPFPVLAGAEFRVDPHADLSDALFHLSAAEGALTLRSTSQGFVDLQSYCKLPPRYWGPASLISSTLEVSGRKPVSGFGLPARVPLADLPMGSTVTLRLLVQAPLIVLDIQGNPTAVLDTFVEQYRWTLGEPPRVAEGCK